MAYRAGCTSCSWQITHFSNKNVTWQGAPTGNPFYDPQCGDGVVSGPKCGRKTGKARADNARSLNNTREYYPEARACRVRCNQ